MDETAGMADMAEMYGMAGMAEMYGMAEMAGMAGMAEMAEMAGMAEMAAGIAEMAEMAEMAGIAGMDDPYRIISGRSIGHRQSRRRGDVGIPVIRCTFFCDFGRILLYILSIESNKISFFKCKQNTLTIKKSVCLFYLNYYLQVTKGQNEAII